MILKILIGCSVLLITASCNDPQNVGDPEICSVYSLQNASNYELTLMYDRSGSYSGSVNVIPGDTGEIIRRCHVGTDPNGLLLNPSAMFWAFEIHAISNNSDKVVYSGINDNDWQLTVTSNEAIYLLVLMDQDLDL